MDLALSSRQEPSVQMGWTHWFEQIDSSLMADTQERQSAFRSHSAREESTSEHCVDLEITKRGGRSASSLFLNNGVVDMMCCLLPILVTPVAPYHHYCSI